MWRFPDDERRPAPRAFDLVVVAGSTGSFAPLSALLGGLPADFPVPIAVVRHVAPHRPSLAAGLLGRHCALEVREVAGEERLRPAVVYLAPPDRHLLARPGGRLTLSTGPKVGFSRPAADPLFTSAARVYGRRVLALVLSGLGRDGARGIMAIKAAGGVAIAQAPATCEARGMPEAALRTGQVDFALPPATLVAALIALCMVPGAARLFRVAPPPAPPLSA